MHCITYWKINGNYSFGNVQMVDKLHLSTQIDQYYRLLVKFAYVHTGFK